MNPNKIQEAILNKTAESSDHLEAIHALTGEMIEKIGENNIKIEEIDGQKTFVVKGVLKGMKGDKGDKGDDGKDGKHGKDGKSGKDGKDGKDGENGLDGIDGVDGKKGDKGDKGDDGKKGKDGKDGTDGKDGEDGSPDTGVEIVNKINDLPLDQYSPKIDAFHIKNLESFVVGGGFNKRSSGDSTVGPGTINEIAYFDSATTIASLNVATYPSLTELSYVKDVSSAIQTQFTGKASTTLNNLGTTSINASLLFDAETYDIGSSTVGLNDLHFGSGGIINFDGGDVTLTHTANTLTFAGGDIVGLGATTATTFNGLAITANGTNTLAITAGKTLTILKTISLTSADDTGGYTLPTGTKTLVATDVASLASLASAVLLPWTGMKPGTDGEIPTFDSSGNPAFVAAGTATHVLTSNGAGAAPTFQAAAAGAFTPKATISTDFETETRFTTLVSGSGTNTFGIDGVVINTTATGTSCAGVQMAYDAATAVFAGSPTFNSSIMVNTIGTTGSSFFGISVVTVTGSGHTYTTSHIGFKALVAASVMSLYATQADGTTENASAALTTLAANNILDISLKVNGTTSVDYYWRLAKGAWSSATNLTSNLPTGTKTVYMQISVSNDAAASQTLFRVTSMVYES